MNKKLFSILSILLIVCFSGGCTYKRDNQSNQETHPILLMYKLNNGDAKFFNDYIITSVDGMLTLINSEGITQTYDSIKVNWLDGVEEDRIIVYGNFDHQIGIVQLDENYQVLSNQIIMNTNNLQIDPTIIKVNDTYYITTTEIEGNINNADPNIENGIYTIHLYKSNNLVDWFFVSDIISEKNNLEDIDIFYQNNHFYVIYEKEKIDKGNSEICLLESLDNKGLLWNDSKVLIEGNCDHEPAKVMQTKEGYNLYYSCDKDNLGTSYMGAKIYYAQYDKDFNLKEQDIEIPCTTHKGILLYDVRTLNDKIQFLFAGDYLTDRDLIVEEKQID